MTDMLPCELPNMGWEQSGQLSFPCPSYSPSEVVCSDQDTGLELLEGRHWQTSPPGASQLASSSCVGAAGHSLLPALAAQAEQVEQQGQAPRAALAAPATSVISVCQVQIKSASVMAVNSSCPSQ